MISDLDIREYLYLTYLKQYVDKKKTAVIEELGLCQGQTRIDIAVVNGSMIGFEIKSEKDNLRRLEVQKSIYGKTLDYVYMVAHINHLTELRKSIPQWWGIISIVKTDSGIKGKTLRKAKRNTSIDIASIVQLLWRDEAFNILQKNKLAEGMSNKPRQILWDKLVNEIPPTKLLKIIRDTIRQRGDWRVALQHK